MSYTGKTADKTMSLCNECVVPYVGSVVLSGRAINREWKRHADVSQLTVNVWHQLHVAWIDEILSTPALTTITQKLFEASRWNWAALINGWAKLPSIWSTPQNGIKNLECSIVGHAPGK